jgi:hypothetical protein
LLYKNLSNAGVPSEEVFQQLDFVDGEELLLAEFLG